MKIDLFRPYVPKEAVEAVTECLRSRFIGQGPKVEEFERKFEEMFFVEHAVSVSSGTAALETAYELAGIKPGDEVITTPLTCTATNLLLKRMDAKIVWADVDKTLCIDPYDVAKKITTRTRAIVQVHLGGIEARCGYARWYRPDAETPMDEIPVISDAAQALGFFSGTYVCCSFQAIKHITTGDGGMIVVLKADEARTARLMRWFGIDREKKIANNWQAYRQRAMTFDIELPGTKRHMTDIAAAMGIEGLKKYDYVIAHRGKLFNLYCDLLDGVDGIKMVEDVRNTFWLAQAIVERRDDFASKLFEADVDTNVVQVRNDIYKIFGGQRADLPFLNSVEEKYISLPLGMHVTPEDVHYICDEIKKGW